MARLFISYSRVDRLFVQALAEKIRRLYGYDNVWFDEGLHGGDIWWEEILDQIAACDIFIYVLTNESVQSPYCQAEFAEARRLQKQIITVQARDRTLLTDELGDIHYVNMAGGANDADALTELIRSINKRMEKIPGRPPRPLWEPRTPKPAPVKETPRPADAPDVDTLPLQKPPAEVAQAAAAPKPWWRKTGVITVAVLIPLIAAVIILLPRLLDRLSSIQPTPAPTPGVAQGASETPTLSGFQQLQTVEAQRTQAKETQAAFDLTATEAQVQRVSADATAQRLAATETAAYATLIALSATPTPTSTSTFTPTVTSTPTPTLTPVPTVTSMPILSSLMLAQTPVARNRDWTPVVEEFDGVEMVLVPAGSFEMGSTDSDIDYALALCNEARQEGTCDRAFFDDEAPANMQVFSDPFWLDKTEVTRAMYQQCIDAGVCTQPPTSDVSTQPDQPINRVTWFQANEYCVWRGARLPTEAEWEYAARGPDGLLFPWGNEINGDEANHCDGLCATADWASGFTNLNPEHDDGYAITAPVGSYPVGASWVGALDMSGNVWEWMSSLHEGYPYDPDDGRERDTGTDPDVVRVMRGGSFAYTADGLRAAFRNGVNPDDTYFGDGFRCARSQ